MEIKDAIRKLEFIRDRYQERVDNRIDEGKWTGEELTNVWEFGTPATEAFKDIVQACEVSIAALQKADKKMPMRDGRDHYCPSCATYIKSYEDYCYACGQRIDWSHLRKKVTING